MAAGTSAVDRCLSQVLLMTRKGSLPQARACADAPLLDDCSAEELLLVVGPLTNAVPSVVRPDRS